MLGHKIYLPICFVLSTCLLAPELTSANESAATDNELELIFYPAPRRLDWATPGSLIRSTVHNWLFEFTDSPADRAKFWFPWENYPHKLSHVNVHLKCESAPEFYGGMSQKWSTDDILRALRGADSFDRLISSFPGSLIPAKDILSWLQILRPRDQARSLVIRLSSPTCLRLSQYLNEYRERGYDKIYSGFIQDPLKGEGAGCAAFAMSFLRVAGLWLDHFDERWRRVVPMAQSMINRPNKPAEFTLLDIMMGDDGSWTRTQPQIQLNIYDPHLMYDWVADVWDGRVQAPFAVQRLRIDGSLALIADLSGRPTPIEPIWPTHKKVIR